MLLSILIPTLPDRINQYTELINCINIQRKQLNCFDKVQIIADDRDRSVPTGTKRNSLINKAEGLYTVFIDDDDKLPLFYIYEVLKAIELNPDVITFKGYMTTNSVCRKDFVIKLNESYEERKGVYYRYPNHLCPMKRELIKGVKFEDITYLEDIKWATKIKELKLLKSEFHINKEMYHYDYIKKK